MFGTESLAIFFGATLLGVVHGAEPGHGWPIAATYALNRSNKWWNGFLASSLLGLGHLVSSLAVVGVFFLAKSHFDLANLTSPIVVGGVAIGGPIGIVAGTLLILLGIREYRHGHAHSHGISDHDHDHDHTHGHDQDHGHDHDHPHPQPEQQGILARIKRAMPFVGTHSHDHPAADEVDSRGLVGIVWAAFVLGFAHEEEFEIIGLCLGSERCLALMVTYAIAVLVALVGLTMFLIAGYQRYEAQLEDLAEHFPTISAAVLFVMGTGFVLGIL